jgi:hypothetical protein
MRNKSLFLFLVCIVAVMSFVSSPPPTHAQAVPTVIYDTDYETPQDELIPPPTTKYGNVFTNDWAADCGVDSSGCVYEDTLSSNGYAPALRYFIGLDYVESTILNELYMWEDECVVNYIEFDLFYYTPDNTALTYEDNSLFQIALSTDWSAALESPTQPYHYDYLLETPFDELEGHVENEWFHVELPLANTDIINSIAIRWNASQVRSVDNGENPVGDWDLRVDNLNIWCDYEVQWIRPLTSEDEHSHWELFDHTYAASLGADISTEVQWVNGFSQIPAAPVHSATPGTITSITPLTTSYEGCLQGGLDIGMCGIVIWREISNEEPLMFKLDLIEAYVIKVAVENDQVLTYIVRNALDYLSPEQISGDEPIGEGCVLGETIELLYLTPIQLENFQGDFDFGSDGISGGGAFTATLTSQLTNTGWVGMLLSESEGDPTRLYPKLTRYPTSDSPCTTNDPRFANCLEDDPQLRQAGDWTTQGNVTFDNPGFTLISSNALVKEVMALEIDVEYGLTVEFEVLEPEPRVELKLGQTVEAHTILESPGAIVTLSIAADLHTPDLTEFWTVRVRNVSNVAVKIISICVSAGEIAGQPTACYFSNDSFDQGVANWDVSEGVGQRDGSITVPSLDTFAQEATLPADEPDTTFELYVEVYIWYEPGTDISRTDYTSTVQMEYQFPDSGATWETLVGPSSSSTTTFSEFVLAAERSGVTVGTVVFQGFIEIDEDTTGTITIRPTVDTEVEGVLGVGIDRACLRGDFGVDQIDDTLGIECQAVTRPQDQLLSSWTVWLWRQFDRFFQCDMMIVHRQIRNTTTEIYRITGWSMRYWKALAFYQADWMNTRLFPWLNGHFNNIASNGGVFYINNSSGAGTNLWDFLVAILQYVIYPIINAAAALLGLIISGVFGLMAIFLVQVFGIISQIIDIIGALIAGWQGATPIPIPGFPTCETDPTTNIMCVPLYILENTIFEPGGPGEIMLTLITAWGSLELILWVVASIRQGLMEAASSA